MIKVKTEDQDNKLGKGPFRKPLKPFIGPLRKPSAAVAKSRALAPAAAATTPNRAIELTTPTRNIGSLKRTMMKYWDRRIDTKATAAGARTTGAYVRQQPMILHA